MKKKHFFSMTLIAGAICIFASCSGGTGAKEVKLLTQEDSLNYALGIINGDGIKNSYFQNDSSEASLAKFIAATDRAFNSEKKDELYNYGVQIGGMLKQQKSKGLMYDSTLVFNQALIKQGLVNGMLGFKEGMSDAQARSYLQETMQKRQMRNQAPVDHSHDGHDHDGHNHSNAPKDSVK